MAGRGAWLIVLGLTALAGCQFASAPPGAAPTATAGRPATVAGTATLTQATASPTGGVTAAPPRTASPTTARAPTPAGGASSGPAPTRTATRPVPTLGRPDAATPTAARGAGPGAILPAGQERLTGDVTSFAASARVMQVRVDGGRERQVSLAASAAIRRADGSAGSAADLRPGQRVQATGRVNGDAGLVAEEVVVLESR